MINTVYVTGREYETQKGLPLFSTEDLAILAFQSIALIIILKFF